MSSKTTHELGELIERIQDAPVRGKLAAALQVLEEARALAERQSDDLDWREECLNLALRANLALNGESLTWTEEEIEKCRRRGEALFEALFRPSGPSLPESADEHDTEP